MPSFSNRDIEEAKRRVREMQERANRYVSGTRDEPKTEKNSADIPPVLSVPKPEPKPKHEPNPEQKPKPKPEPVKESENDEDDPLGDSFNVILLLLLILSYEGADRKLLLALLYLLF